MRVIIEMNPTTYWTKYSGVAHGVSGKYKKGFRGWINWFAVRVDATIPKNLLKIKVLKHEN